MLSDRLSALFSSANSMFAAKLACSVMFFLLMAWLGNRILLRLSRHFEHSPSHWDDTLFCALRPVMVVFSVLMGLSVVIDISLLHFGIEENPVIAPARKIILVILLYAFLVRYLNLVRRSYYRPDSGKVKIDRVSLEFMLKLLQIGLTLAIALTLLQNLGISISGLLTFGGVGALAIGLAAKDMLANLFGGLTLYIDRPFGIGDKVGLVDRKVEGFVEYIGWRQTRIRGYDRTPFYVPNALFTNTAVMNPSRMTHRRISVTVGLRYQDFHLVSAITADIDAYLQNHPSIDPNRDNVARFNEFGDSSLDILVRCYPLVLDWKGYMTVRHEILITVGEIIHRHGADIAYPTRTLEFSGSDFSSELLAKGGNT